MWSKVVKYVIRTLTFTVMIVFPVYSLIAFVVWDTMWVASIDSWHPFGRLLLVVIIILISWAYVEYMRSMAEKDTVKERERPHANPLSDPPNREGAGSKLH